MFSLSTLNIKLDDLKDGDNVIGLVSVSDQLANVLQSYPTARYEYEMIITDDLIFSMINNNTLCPTFLQEKVNGPKQMTIEGVNQSKDKYKMYALNQFIFFFDKLKMLTLHQTEIF